MNFFITALLFRGEGNKKGKIQRNGNPQITPSSANTHRFTASLLKISKHIRPDQADRVRSTPNRQRSNGGPSLRPPPLL
jgi:hypothetical protein